MDNQVNRNYRKIPIILQRNWKTRPVLHHRQHGQNLFVNEQKLFSIWKYSTHSTSSHSHWWTSTWRFLFSLYKRTNYSSVTEDESPCLANQLSCENLTKFYDDYVRWWNVGRLKEVEQLLSPSSKQRRFSFNEMFLFFSIVLMKTRPKITTTRQRNKTRWPGRNPIKSLYDNAAVHIHCHLVNCWREEGTWPLHCVIIRSSVYFNRWEMVQCCCTQPDEKYSPQKFSDTLPNDRTLYKSSSPLFSSYQTRTLSF